ncbi:hypothetical protein VT03_16830 [Planctomyces sp. SH-PL14]|nr:hypothetical protein VT03_16830 [Planctomyces sp. SH-PL14]
MNEPVSASAPHPSRARGLEGGVILFVLLMVALSNWALRSSINQLAPKPVLEFGGATWTQTGDVEEIVFAARVKNNGGTGAVTVYANLETDSGKWEQRETVVIPKFYGEDFRFVFRSWTGTNPTYSLSLSEDHWSHHGRRVAVPPYSEGFLLR